MTDFTGLDTLEYSFANEEFRNNTRELMPEQALWCAVINQALTDALNGSRTARDWLLCEKEDFIFVCSLAGISPFCVRSAAHRQSAARGL